MKKFLLPLVFLFMSNCSSSKIEKPIKIKTFKNEHYIVNYPNTWKKFGAIGFAYFMPKIIRENTHENEIEHVSINDNTIPIDANDDIENILYNYGNFIRKNEKLKNFRLIKLESNPKFIYKIESLRVYNFKPGVYKREEYFYIKNGRLGYVIYQMREDLFDFYHKDALQIINSVEHKK